MGGPEGDEMVACDIIGGTCTVWNLYIRSVVTIDWNISIPYKHYSGITSIFQELVWQNWYCRS